MQLFRFMSQKEFQKYIRGEKLTNTTKHNIERNQKTNSVGFCFLNIEEYEPEHALHFLTGIVNFEVCAIFEVDKRKVNKTWGRYAKPLEPVGNAIEDLIKLINGFHESFIANEYSTTEYSIEDFKLIKYAIPEWNNKNQWKWKEDYYCINFKRS